MSTEEKHPGGRPSKYTEETIGKVQKYLETYEDEGDLVPSVSGLACFLEVRRETLHEWARQEKKVEFSNMLEQILAKQEGLLVNNGLNGTFNPTITKLMLAKHGYSEKTETDITTAGQPITGIERKIIE